MCGNPALLTSHTLFSCSYKPLMPQKMLSLLWPGTAEGGGKWGGGWREGGGVWPGLCPVWQPWPSSPPFLSPLLFSQLPILSSPLLSCPLLSLHSALPLSPSQEDLARPDLGSRCLSYKRIKPTQGLRFLSWSAMANLRISEGGLR